MMDGAKASDAAVSTVPASAPGTPQTPPATGTTTTTTSTTTTQTTAQPGQPATRASDLAGLLWLNPGATSLSQGQETVLRYRATGGLPLDGAQLLLPAGLTGFTAALERQPGASEFAVRVQRSADSASDAALANTLPGGLLTPACCSLPDRSSTSPRFRWRGWRVAARGTRCCRSVLPAERLQPPTERQQARRHPVLARMDKRPLPRQRPRRIRRPSPRMSKPQMHSPRTLRLPPTRTRRLKLRRPKTRRLRMLRRRRKPSASPGGFCCCSRCWG